MTLRNALLPSILLLVPCLAWASDTEPVVMTSAGADLPLQVSAGYLILHAAEPAQLEDLPSSLTLTLPGTGRVVLGNPLDWSPGFGVRLYELRLEGTPAPVTVVERTARMLAARPDLALVTPLYLFQGNAIFVGPRILARFPAAIGAEDGQRIAAEYGLVPDEPVHTGLGIWAFRMPGATGEGLLRTAARMNGDPRIVWAADDFFREYRPDFVPNDPMYPQQWHLDDSPGDVDVNAPIGWDSWQGHADSSILVIDTGTEGAHPDLYQNIWINQGEIPASKGLVDADGDTYITFDDLNPPGSGPNAGKITDRNGNGRIDPTDLVDESINNFGLENGLDDDGNTFVDDVVGVHWPGANYNNDPYRSTYTCDPHGTSVAGVAAARGNNGVGVSGACPRCRILGVGGICYGLPDSVMSRYFLYAADNGFISSNNSWGYGYPVVPLPQSFKDAFDHSWTNGRGGRGTLHYWSSGNDHPRSVDTNGIASYPRVLAIGAVADNGFKAFYSEEGVSLDFSAPSNGGARGITTTDLTVGGYSGGNYAFDFGGTSSASPLACGVGSLLVSAMPALKPDRVYEILKQTAKKTGGGYDPNGFSRQFGWGMVRAGEALALADDGRSLFDKPWFSCGGDFTVVSVRDSSLPATAVVRVTSPSEPAGELLVCDPVARRPGLYEGTIEITALPPTPGDGKVSIVEGDTVSIYYPQAAGTPVDTVNVNCSVGCGALPAFGGAVSATDNSACVYDGILVYSIATTDWGDASDGQYNVYRSTTPGFTPSDANRLRTVLSSSFVDNTVAPDQSYYYIVRAENNRFDCAGPHGGAEEPNIVEVGAADTALAPPAFGGARLGEDVDGCQKNGVRITWDPASGGGAGAVAWYNIYYATIPAFDPDPSSYHGSVPAGGPTEYIALVSAPNTPYYFIVRAENDVAGCAGPHGGVEDRNFASVEATDMTIQPPTFGGIVAASDNALCSNDGVLVTWNAVANWGPGGAGWYNVYRSIASPVEPLQANLVGSAPSGTTSYLDGTAQTGVTYSYLVKAESAATGNCLGTPHGGRQDDNTAEIQATEDYLPAPGAPGMIRVELLPDRSTRITWDPIPNASVTNVYRGYIPSNRFSYNHLCWKPDLTGTEVIDIQRPTSGRGWYYLISGENSCGETPLGPDSAGNALPYRIQCL